MNKHYQSAKWYLQKKGFSVIPVGQNKIPLISWEEYQKRLPTIEELNIWWKKYPQANVGIVCGKVPNLAVIDIDDPQLDNETIKGIEEFLEPPTCITPRGGRHLYFTYPSGSDLRNAVSIVPKVDIRAEGGYVLAPPSCNEAGVEYKWRDDRRIDKLAMSEFPMSVVKLVSKRPVKNDMPPFEMFTEGRRDDDLFHIANTMVKGGAQESEIRATLTQIALTCKPPFPADEMDAKVDSALKRAERKERNLTEEVRRWVSIQDGYFDTSILYRELGLITMQEKSTCYTIISRLVKEGLIEKYGNKTGQYRTANTEIDIMDWENASTEHMDVVYPLGIHNYVVTYPGNVFVIAGSQNSGKTTFNLNFTNLNKDRHEIHYFNSEMGEGELKVRLQLFEEPMENWKKVTFYERNSNFDDVIKPTKINIIDYLEVLNDFWTVGEQIKAIHNKLTTGIAIIAIQKNKNTELGRGGGFGTEKPRLYLSMDYGHIKMVKAKNWRTALNPNGLCCDFNIVRGSQFVENEKGWYKADEA